MDVYVSKHEHHDACLFLFRCFSGRRARPSMPIYRVRLVLSHIFPRWHDLLEVIVSTDDALS